MTYFKKLIGKKCYLSPIQLDDAEIYTKWLNDLVLTVNLAVVAQQITLEKERDFLGLLTKEGNYAVAIVANEGKALIGNCGLVNVDLINRIAELGIFIGDTEYWGQGYGEEAVNLLLDYGFNVLNLQNITLSVFDFNERAITCYEKCGFKPIGRRRQAKILAGKVHDILLMDILADEYESVYIKDIVAASP